MKGTYKHDLMYGTNHQYSLMILKKVMGQFIFPTKSILKLELAAQTILSSLLERFIPYNLPSITDQTAAEPQFACLNSNTSVPTYKAIQLFGSPMFNTYTPCASWFACA